MSNPYLPPRDADFATWLTNFAAVGAAAPATFGLSVGEVTALNASSSDFVAALALATDPGTRGPATVAAKDAQRATSEALVRPIAVRISQSSGISSENKVSIGVTVRSTGRTPVPPPVTSPALILESAAPGLLNLQFRDSTTPNSRKKPVGVTHCELWASIGTTAATDPSQCSFVGAFTRTPFQWTHGAAAGKTATLFCRWTNRSGAGGLASVGPWSAPLTTAII